MGKMIEITEQGIYKEAMIDAKGLYIYVYKFNWNIYI